ncbi:hypothetical protein [Piscinibacter sp.]|uniref:hypothetical protein n=1 Tax=Piscinibacter sp. TaxID=1903157 RepID=UPI002D8104D3|nr:hypothetical protein [Albitalea sp.]
MSEAFARQWRDVVGQGLSQHEVLRLAMALASRIRSLAQGDPLDPESATELAIDLKAFQAQLRSPAARRVVGKVEDAQQFFLPALSRFSMASEVTTSMSADAVKLVASEFEAVRALLLKLEADGIGLLFVAGSDGFLRPSPEFDRFAKTAGAMIDTQRGGDSAYIEATFDDPGSRVWQVVSGEQSRTVLARRPKNGALPGLDERLGFALQQFAVEQYRLGVERALWLSVRRSRGAAGGASVRERVAGLRSSADFYQRAIGKDNIAEDSIVLVAMTEDGLQILSQLRADLAAADPYIQLMSELQRDWESAGGGAPLSASAVAARTGFARDTLREQYLAAAHKVLDALTALHGVVPRHPSTDFWRTLAQDFVQYDNSAPGNGISELEAAFLAATRASAGGRCKAGLEVRPPKGGYFGGRLAALEENFNRACDVARRHALQADYDGFAMWFNGAVAGHFPFGERVGALPLPPRVLPGLLERYRGLRDAQKAVGSEWPAEVKPFLPGLDALLAQYAGEGPAVGTSPGDVNTHKPLQYQLLLGQRRRHERLGEHVMEWRLTAGGREYRRKSEAQSFEWTIGERIELRLRFAANSPYRPVAGSGYSVDGAAAVFSFGGDWALYTMLKQHRTEATEARVATLRFQVQLEGPDGKQLAVVYADLIGNGPDSLRVLSLPARAPAFEASR